MLLLTFPCAKTALHHSLLVPQAPSAPPAGAMAGAAPEPSVLPWLSAPKLPLQRGAHETFVCDAGLHTYWPNQGPHPVLIALLPLCVP